MDGKVLGGEEVGIIQKLVQFEKTDCISCFVLPISRVLLLLQHLICQMYIIVIIINVVLVRTSPPIPLSVDVN